MFSDKVSSCILIKGILLKVDHLYLWNPIKGNKICGKLNRFTESSRIFFSLLEMECSMLSTKAYVL